jgi:hypothetical protein
MASLAVAGQTSSEASSEAPPEPVEDEQAMTTFAAATTARHLARGDT